MSRTQDKGDAAELLVRSDLRLLGFNTLSPDDSSSHYDLVVDFNNSFFKIQIKCGQLYKDNRIKVDARKPSAKSRIYEKLDYDILAVVDLENKRIAYLHHSDFIGKSKLTLWVTRNIPKHGINAGHKTIVFDDYESFPRAIGKFSENEEAI